MKRFIALFIALLMLATSLCACTNTQDPADTKGSATDKTTVAENPKESGSDTVSNSVSDTVPAVTEPSHYEIQDDLGTMNLGKKITILYWSDVERHEFDVAEITGDRVDDAIRSRNLTVEKRLGVELVWEGTPGKYQLQADFVNKVKEGNTENAYDIIAGYSLTAATIALNGYSQNMLELPYLNFEKPWWPESLIGQATINDKLYFASGDISTMFLHMMYGVLFNKKMIDDLGLSADDPYTLVLNDKWTLGKMMEMCATAYSDIGTDQGKVDVGDQFGYVSTDINFDGLFTGCGLRTIDKNDTGLIVSETFGSDKAQELVEKLVDFFNTDTAFGNKDPKNFSSSLIFAENRALFTMDRVYVTSSDNMLAVGDSIKYGVVPCPKYDTKQKNYVTMLGFPYTMYSISSASKNPEAAAAVLECLGSEGFRKVTPELYETVMKVKYTSDDTASQMYDLIKECVYIDLGRIFSTDLANITYSHFRNCVDAGNINYLTQFPAKATLLNGYLEKINAKFYND